MNSQENRGEERAQSRGRRWAKREHLPHPEKAHRGVLIQQRTGHAVTVEFKVNTNYIFVCGISMFRILHRNTYTRKQLHPGFVFANFGSPAREVSVGHTWEEQGARGWSMPSLHRSVAGQAQIWTGTHSQALRLPAWSCPGLPASQGCPHVQTQC